MTRMGLEIAADDELPIVKSDSSVLTRSQLRRFSDELLLKFSQRSTHRALVCSELPVHILRALDACNRGKVDLYIAHPDTDSARLVEILAEFAIQMRIGATDEYLEAHPAPSGGPHVFLMSSGTTGRPKICAQRLEAIIDRLRPAATLPENRGARWLATYQHTTTAGLQVLLSACLSGGTVIEAPARSIAAMYGAAREARVTHVSATPTFWRSLLTVHRLGHLPLRHIVIGGEVIDQSLIDALAEAFPEAKITHTYASTEAGLVYSVSDKRAGFPTAWLDDPRHPNRMRVRDGYLEVKLAHLPSDLPARQTMSLAHDEWFKTRDRCEIRGDRVFVIGRDDGAINVGGIKVQPELIEAFVRSLPNVIDARCYAVPNSIAGFLVGIDVHLASGQEPEAARTAISATCQREFSRFEVPRVINFVEGLTLSRSGKNTR